VLKLLQLLGRGDGARGEPVLVAGLAHPHLLDVGLGLVELALQVADGRLRQHDVVATGGDEPLQPHDLGHLRQVGALVGQLVQGGVERLQVEQPELGERVGLHALVLLEAVVHGSVHSVETVASTSTTLASATAAADSHGHSVAQCAASTRPSPASDAGWWRRSDVR